MRFRKSVNIAKGVKLNLSKTGASVTVGKGPVSFNLGSKGAFFNWSVPGTGVYDRVRIDTLLRDKLGGLFGDHEQPEQPEKAEKAAKTEKAKAAAEKKPARAPEQPEDEELARLEREQAFFTLQKLAPDVAQEAGAGEMDGAKAEDAIEGWFMDAEAPVEFNVQTEAVPERRAVMIDLDLPEIEDMPADQLVETEDGALRIKKKTKQEQREDYRTCAFGLGVYVAANAFQLVPQAERALVSAYTQRRSASTGDAHDAFIYSVVFDRARLSPGFQKRDPYDLCGDMKGRFYQLASGEMKEIEPYGADDLA